MNFLVTAGNTQVPIDRVRCITNIFSGRTGTSIALHCRANGHAVTLLTSHPELVAAPENSFPTYGPDWQFCAYKTFEDLGQLLKDQVCQKTPDVIIHCAAVSDYLAAGIFAPATGTHFDPQHLDWHGLESTPPILVDMSAGKVKSSTAELWLRLLRAPKLVDLFRTEWAFRGILVKFKLEVGLEDEALLAIAETSRIQSQADLMVANTLEEAHNWAFIGPLAGKYQKIPRLELPTHLLAAIEAISREKSHG